MGARRAIEKMLICILALAAVLTHNQAWALMALTLAVIWIGEKS